MDDFTKHTCGECRDYSCGGCSELCCPRKSTDTACSRLRICRPSPEADRN